MARKPVPVTDIGSSGVIVNAGSVADDGGGTESSAPIAPGNDGPEIINGFDSYNPVDGETGDSGSGEGGTGKRRGRPRGRYNKNGERATKKVNLGGLEQILLSLHMMAGAFFEAPELALAPDEAKAMAEAASTVAALYHHTLDPRMLAWVNLAMVCGGIYGTRIIVIRTRLKAEANTTPKSNVVPIATGGTAKPGPQAAPPSQMPRTPADLYNPMDYTGFAPNIGD